MQAAGRFVINVALVFSLLMLVALSWVIAGYARQPGGVGGVDDWAILLLPLAPPAVTAALAVVAMRAAPRGLIGSAFLVTCVGASSLYLLIPAAHLLLDYPVVAGDGTAYWGVLAMPAFWLWLPAALVMLLVGITLAAIKARRARAEQQGRPPDT
jgi:hypothetical protein